MAYQLLCDSISYLSDTCKVLERGVLFGIDDPQILLAYLATFGIVIVGIVYGILNWNKGGE
jgi:hypothetical protein